MPASSRPRVVCHMMASVDGRIVTHGWPLSPDGRRQYEEVHATYGAQGWLCGRVTHTQWLLIEAPFPASTEPVAEPAPTSGLRCAPFSAAPMCRIWPAS